MRVENSKFKILNSKYSFLVVLFFSIFSVLYSTLFVSAVSISPLKHIIVIDPGNTQDVAFEIHNNTQVEKTYRMSVDGFSIDSKSGAAVFGTTSRAVSWVTFPNVSTFTLAPNTKREMVATIDVPSGEVAQTYYLAVFAQEVSDVTGGTGVGARVGTLVFLTVGGIVTENLDIDYIVPQQWFSIGEPSIVLQLSNNGGIALPYVGILTVTRLNGTVVDQIYMNDTVDVIYAQTKQERTYAWGSLPWRSIGPLRVSAVVTYGASQQMVTGTTLFWYLPWYAFVGLFGVLFVSIGFFILVRRRYLLVL